VVDSPVTVFLGTAGIASSTAVREKIDQLMSIVTETEQIADRRNYRLNSRAQISDGSGTRFFSALGKSLRCEFNALPSPKTIEWE
jgi:hypothetical protein